jgi:hypothetical protein
MPILKTSVDLSDKMHSKAITFKRFCQMRYGRIEQKLEYVLYATYQTIMILHLNFACLAFRLHIFWKQINPSLPTMAILPTVQK